MCVCVCVCLCVSVCVRACVCVCRIRVCIYIYSRCKQRVNILNCHTLMYTHVIAYLQSVYVHEHASSLACLLPFPLSLFPLPPSSLPFLPPSLPPSISLSFPLSISLHPQTHSTSQAIVYKYISHFKTQRVLIVIT